MRRRSIRVRQLEQNQPDKEKIEESISHAQVIDEIVTVAPFEEVINDPGITKPKRRGRPPKEKVES